MLYDHYLPFQISEEKLSLENIKLHSADFTGMITNLPHSIIEEKRETLLIYFSETSKNSLLSTALKLFTQTLWIKTMNSDTASVLIFYILSTLL